jgi:hypothetical protein
VSLGHRIYLVEGDAIRPVAQKTFHGFFFKKEPALPAYSGQTVTFAMPIYEIENRRPVRVVRLDTLRLTVKDDGSLDQDQYHQLVADTFTALFPAADTARPAETNTVDAEMLFARKRRENRWSPKISEAAYGKILAHLKIPQ